MKKLYLLTTICALSALAVSVCFAQPPPAKISEERRAEVERELDPRGEKIGLLVVFHGAGTHARNKLTD